MLSHSEAMPMKVKAIDKGLGLILVALAVLTSCSTTPPRNTKDGCEIFDEKSGWYKAAFKSARRWGVSVSIQLAIIYQESRFKHDAKTPRGRLLWVIPWGRQSSAYGYAQVQDGTWRWYQRDTGNRGARRDNFKDVVDFIGWYNHENSRQLGIAKTDAYRLYLAYHEGHAGYARGSYRKKPWLLEVARKVEQRAASYAEQMRRCEHRLDRGWRIWPF